MTLDPAACYRALRTRDARFDGRFFTAVRTTGIYCRPICPAPLPRRENCWFVPCAAAAQEAGFRPCLRCRPEASPGTPAWLGTSATVSRALRLIGDGALDRGSVDDLAERLGVGDRHLRRLFLQHLGATPVTVAQTRRILFAKKLLDETDLPMSEVALASGFASIRRFNAALRTTYERPPRELRRARRGRTAPLGDGAGIVLHLPYRAPYPWDDVLRFLAGRAIPGVEEVADGVYRRSVRLGDGSQGRVEVCADIGAPRLVARLELSSSAGLIEAAERLRRIFDLGADPVEIGADLGADRRLRSRLADCPGVRVPGAWDGFELAVRAIVGQQVSVAGASTLAGRIAARWGEPLDGNGPSVLFPAPEMLAEADLGAIGLPGKRAEAVRGLARAVADEQLDFDGPRGLEAGLAALEALPGIGPWTAQVVAMRALREPDAFPAGDLGLRRALGTKSAPASERQVAKAAEAWRPWRAYAAMLLWWRPSRAGLRAR